MSTQFEICAPLTPVVCPLLCLLCHPTVPDISFQCPFCVSPLHPEALIMPSPVAPCTPHSKSDSSSLSLRLALTSCPSMSHQWPKHVDTMVDASTIRVEGVA